MRETVFDALAPVCPRCLHGDGLSAPIVVADRVETRSDHLWQGILHCSNQNCWMEFPVIDGIPVLVADPRTYIANSQAHILRRPMMSEALTGMLADAIGPGSEFETTRQHLSLYAGAQYSDWATGTPASGLVDVVHTGLDMLGAAPKGPVLDLGGSVGRTGFELGALGAGPVLVADLNFSMLQLGQTLAIEGAAQFDLRHVGLVFERQTVTVPEAFADAAPDFWALDAAALPFEEGRFETVCALNLVDCVASPTGVIAEMARVMAPGAGAVICTPYDWSPSATELGQWLGGHSQRGPLRGRSEQVLTQTLAHAGLPPVAENHDQSWRLRTHARATMEYQLHLLACRRAEAAEPQNATAIK